MSFGTLKKNLKRDVRATCILIKIEFFLWQLRNFDPRNRLNTVWFYLINVCFSSILKNWEHLLRFLFLLLWSTKKTIRTIDGRVIGLLLAFQIFKLTPMMPNKEQSTVVTYIGLVNMKKINADISSSIVLVYFLHLWVYQNTVLKWRQNVTHILRRFQNLTMYQYFL